ncbi:IclR family transcriptional regulator [Bacillus sp. J14TS2]|uniref:IclR family transcriptional regulator n=1 Tax=Bacillus sp. J14TS2 TaxID=2807188 RepID=UPI001B2426A9|nr:IclR family transcriptional regulator [Bacillus sp. J14TS2]GIN70605.1 IclR family transcriptional regulator [Bacillus sp. J14TS2]
MSKQKEYSVPAIERAIMILNALSDREMTIHEIHSELGIPKTTAFVILNTLEKHHLIDKKNDGTFCLGHQTFQWGMSYYNRIDLVKIAHPLIEQLVKNTPYTAHLAVLSDNQPIYIDKAEGNGFVRFATSIGQRLPLLSSGVGKALAPLFSEDELENILVKEKKKKQHIANLKDELNFLKQNGYAIEDEEMEEGIRCLAAPVYGLRGNIMASISITALSRDLPAVKFPEWGEKAKTTATEISHQLGFYETKETQT